MAITGLKISTKTLLPIILFSMNAAAIRHYASELGWKNDGRNPEPEEYTDSAAADERRRGYWFPHPRSGIYFPKGQDLMMEDIPNDAAAIHPTFWLRSADEGIDHKAHTDDFTFHTSN